MSCKEAHLQKGSPQAVTTPTLKATNLVTTSVSEKMVGRFHFKSTDFNTSSDMSHPEHAEYCVQVRVGCVSFSTDSSLNHELAGPNVEQAGRFSFTRTDLKDKQEKS